MKPESKMDSLGSRVDSLLVIYKTIKGKFQILTDTSVCPARTRLEAENDCDFLLKFYLSVPGT